MLWEELTGEDFGKGVEECGGVCILPIGVIEKHGDHLPVGMDMYSVTAIAKKAAEISSAIVFPYYFFGQISEARHVPGCLAPSHKLIMDSLLEMCDEISRNGFKKIIILSGHGGNMYFLPFFAQMFPGMNRSYQVYINSAHMLSSEQVKDIQNRAGVTDLGSHGGFKETSVLLHLRPDLVHMDRIKVKESENMGRLKSLEEKRIYTGFNWYSSYPHHFAGDPSASTAEYGKYIFDIMVSNAVNVINTVKADDVSLKLISEYNPLAS